MAAIEAHLRTLPSPAFSTPFLPIGHCRCRTTSTFTVTHHRLLLFLSSASPPQLYIRRSSRRATGVESSHSLNKFDEGENADGIAEKGTEVLEEFIDSIFIFKVFGSFGWMLPAIILSMLFATGPKTFLLALGVPIGFSTFSFAITRFQNRDNIKPKDNDRAGRRTSGAFASMSSALSDTDWVKTNQMPKKMRKNPSPDAKTSHNDTNSTRLGGWDELDAVVTAGANGSEESGASNGFLGGWDEVVQTVKPKNRSSRRAFRKFVRRIERNERKRKEEMWSPNVWPLLLRLIIFVSPFLNSWIDMLR